MIHKESFIKFKDIQEIKDFCKNASYINGCVTVYSGLYRVDGKSLLGILSLDCSGVTLVALCSEDETDVEKFNNLVKNIQIKEED